MKYFLKLFLFVCTISLVVIACTKEDDEPCISTFSAMVDASNFVLQMLVQRWIRMLPHQPKSN